MSKTLTKKEAKEVLAKKKEMLKQKQVLTKPNSNDKSN